MDKKLLNLDFGKQAFIIIMLSLAFFPFYIMLIMSFKSNAQVMQNIWTLSLPLEANNWVKGWLSIKDYIANTLVIAVSSISLMLTSSILAAYVFARYKIPGSKLLFAAFMLLMCMPGITNLIPLFNIMKNLHLLNSIVGLVLVLSAGGQVFCLFVLKSFIEELPSSLFEAANMDGASHLRVIFNIVIPLSKPILATLAIWQLIGIWNNFLLPFILLRNETLYPLAVGLLRLEGEYTKNYGELMAAYTISAIPIILLFIFTAKVFVKGITAGAVKG